MGSFSSFSSNIRFRMLQSFNFSSSSFNSSSFNSSRLNSSLSRLSSSLGGYREMYIVQIVFYILQIIFQCIIINKLNKWRNSLDTKANRYHVVSAMNWYLGNSILFLFGSMIAMIMVMRYMFVASVLVIALIPSAIQLGIVASWRCAAKEFHAEKADETK